MKTISISEFCDLLPKTPLSVIDIRDNYQYQLGHIPGAQNVPMNFLLTIPDNYLQKDKTYYLYCDFGSRSARCCRELEYLGYQVVNIAGGYQEYRLYQNNK